MSDAYEINGVKVTPAAGGYYDLNHSSLSEPERVRGKEKADQRAAEIAKAAEKPEGHMDPQGDLDADKRNAAEKVQEADAGVNQKKQDPEQAKADNAHAKVQEELAAAKARIAELEKAAKPLVTTVGTEQPPEPAIPHTVPTAFTGALDADGKKALKSAGLDYTRIVLEENENIPPTGLFVSVNGRSYQISPGEEVDVPNFILGVLDDAVTSAPVVDSKTQKVLGYRNRSKYPYRRV